MCILRKNEINICLVKKLIQPSQGEGFGELALTGLPWMGKMGRYGASEMLRNKNMQRKLIS